MTGRIVQGTILGIVLAIVFNWLVYAYGQSRSVSFLVQQPNSTAPQTISLGMIIIASIITIIIGAIILWALSRFTDNALMIFLWLAAIVALISLVGPYQMALGIGSFATLGLMHIITATAAATGLAIFFQRCENCIAR